MPQEQPSSQNLSVQDQPKNQPAKPRKEKPLTFRWILLGIAAIIVMWLLSSLWFK